MPFTPPAPETRDQPAGGFTPPPLTSKGQDKPKPFNAAAAGGFQNQSDPFAGSKLPANAAPKAVLDDLHTRATNLQQWRDRSATAFADQPDRLQQVEGDYNRQRDQLNAEAKAHGLHFNIFKTDDEIMADKVAQASLTPDEMSAFVGKRAAKMASGVESGVAQFAGGISDPANSLYLAMGGEPRLAEVMTKPFIASMVTSGGVQTIQGVRAGDAEQTTAGLLTLGLPIAGKALDAGKAAVAAFKRSSPEPAVTPARAAPKTSPPGAATAPAAPAASVDLTGIDSAIWGNQLKTPAGAKPAPKMQIAAGDVEKAINQFLADNNLPVNAWDNDQRLEVHNMIRATFGNIAVDQQLHPGIIKAGLGMEPFLGHLKRNGLLPQDWQPQVRDGFGSGLRLPTEEEKAQKQQDLYGKIDIQKARQFIADDVNKKSPADIKEDMFRKIRAGLPVPADHVLSFKDARLEALLSDQGFVRSEDGQWFTKGILTVPPQQQKPDKDKGTAAPVKFSQLQQGMPAMGWFKVTAPFDAPDGSTYLPGKDVSSGQLERWGMKLPTAEAEAFAGAQAEPPTATAIAPAANIPTVEFPIAKLKLSADVPNFKTGANTETGVVPGEKLGGQYERTGTAPIVAWERLNGDTEVITGRHRLDLARRTGEKTIPTQIVREADGFTKDKALRLDAEANIRDGQGEINDYATYFKGTTISEAEAAQRGLLARAKGRDGFVLAKSAAPDLYALWQGGKVSDRQAVAIARAAPNDATAQRLGSKYALAGKPPEFLTNIIQATKLATGGGAKEIDLFGNDDSAMKQMEKQANRAAGFQKDLRDRLQVLAAGKKSSIASSEGIDVKDPGAIPARMAQLKTELADWENWPMKPELVARVKGETPPPTSQPDPKQTPPGATSEENLTLKAPTEEELKAEAAAAKTRDDAAKLAGAAAKPLTGTAGDLGQGDLLDAPKDLFAPPPPSSKGITRLPMDERLRRAGIKPSTVIKVFHGGPANALERNWPKWFTTSRDRASAYGKGSVHEAAVIPKNPAYSKVTLSQEQAESILAKGHDAIIIGSKENPIDVILPDAKGLIEHQGPSRIEGMGGPIRRAAEVSAKATRQAVQAADKELRDVDEEFTGAVKQELADPAKPGSQIFYGLRQAFNPMSLGNAAKQTATVLRYMLGQRGTMEARFDFAMKKFRDAFDRRTTPRNYVYDEASPLPPNWEMQRAVDTGETENLTPPEKTFAEQGRKLLDAEIARIQKFKPDVLNQLHEFYFPRYWRDEDAAEAVRLSQVHRPLEGPKGFLKARSLALWDDALKRGLRPRFDNPADALRTKLGEMAMFRTALAAHENFKELGLRRFNYIFEKRPDGWVEPHDVGAKVFAPPTVTIAEAFDEQMRTKTYEMFKSLGISNDRLANIGGARWGWAGESPEHVRTKFGGMDAVFWHEFGHIMDFRYPDLRDALGLTGRGTGKDVFNTELRALADARLPTGDTGVRQRTNPKTGKPMKVRSSFSSYTRRAEEKMANVFDAYLRAPDLFAQHAPNVLKAMNLWLEKHPEVKGPLNDIRPSLQLGTGTAEQFVGGPILLGHWIMPEEAANVLNNYLDPGLWGKSKTLRGTKTLGGLISNVRLISAFHGQMVGNDALASGLSLPLYDAMKAVADKHPALLKRAGADLLRAPIRPFLALRQGSQMMKGLRMTEAQRTAAGISDLNLKYAHLAMAANLRAGHMNSVENASRGWRQGLFETMNALKAGNNPLPAGLDTLLHTPMMISHEMMRPIMEWFVPRMKMGLMAPMISRIVADNPDADVWELRAKLGKAADAVEDRVGQVTYDNLFQSRVVKDSGQLALQAYGWHLTKERLLFGAATDYFRAGKALLTGQRPDITFRMSYLPALVMTHAIIGGTIMYALTGRRPKSLTDYLFPETGLVDAYGRPVRMALADFLKDYVGEWNAAMHGPKAVVTEWERRLMPVWNELADMYRNRDFWNTKIFSERNFAEPEYQHVWTNLKEGVNYLAGSSAPFSYKGATRFQQSLGPNATMTQKALAHFGPYFGFVPAPTALTQTPAEALAGEIMRDSLPAMSQDQAAHVKAVTQLVQDLRTGRINDAGVLAARVRSTGVKDQAELTRIAERVSWTPLQYQLHKLPIYEPGSGRDAMTVWDLMSDPEKLSTVGIFADKVQRAYAGGKLDRETTSRLVKILLPYVKAAAAQKAVPAPAPGAGRSAIFNQ